MSFASMHNDYLDPDRHDAQPEPPCESCIHDTGSECALGNRCDYSEKTEPASATQVGGDHYTRMGVQPWTAMQSWLTADEFAGFLRGNAIKYLARAGAKGAAIEDYRKARHYLDRLIEASE